MNTIPRPRAKPFSMPDPLTQKERERFRAILADEVFRKVLARVQNMKPSAFTGGVSDASKSATDRAQTANDRLHEIRGWEMFEHALFLQAEDKKRRADPAQETFPDSGMIDYEK